MTQGFAAGGEANTASNQGTGVGQIFKGKVNEDLQFKGIKDGTDTTVTQSTTDVMVNITTDQNPTANTIPKRDSGGRMKAGAPISADDVVIKSYADGTGTHPTFLAPVAMGNTFAVTNVTSPELGPILARAGGKVWVLYRSTTSGGLKVAYTTNDGTSWSTSTIDATTASKASSAHIGALDDNTIYVSYSDGTNTKLAKTTNGGSTWSNVSTIAPSIDGVHTRIKVLDASNIYVFLLSGTPGASITTRFYKSGNSGTTWGPAVVVSSGTSGCSAMDMVVLSSTNIVVAVGSARFYTSTDSGATFSDVGGTNIINSAASGALYATDMTRWFFVVQGNSEGVTRAFLTEDAGGTITYLEIGNNSSNSLGDAGPSAMLDGTFHFVVVGQGATAAEGGRLIHYSSMDGCRTFEKRTIQAATVQAVSQQCSPVLSTNGTTLYIAHFDTLLQKHLAVKKAGLAVVR